MIQIIVCSCTKQKFRECGANFYSQETFYENIDHIFGVPCQSYSFFKERFGGGDSNLKCNYLN